jgi:hypothetical protein
MSAERTQRGGTDQTIHDGFFASTGAHSNPPSYTHSHTHTQNNAAYFFHTHRDYTIIPSHAWRERSE